MYVPYHPAHTLLTPRSDPAQTSLKSRFHVKIVARRAVANIHPTPTIDKLRLTMASAPAGV
jgi:hypothetical protein